MYYNIIEWQFTFIAWKRFSLCAIYLCQFYSILLTPTIISRSTLISDKHSGITSSTCSLVCCDSSWPTTDLNWIWVASPFDGSEGATYYWEWAKTRWKEASLNCVQVPCLGWTYWTELYVQKHNGKHTAVCNRGSWSTCPIPMHIPSQTNIYLTFLTSRRPRWSWREGRAREAGKKWTTGTSRYHPLLPLPLCLVPVLPLPNTVPVIHPTIHMHSTWSLIFMPKPKRTQQVQFVSAQISYLIAQFG